MAHQGQQQEGRARNGRWYVVALDGDLIALVYPGMRLGEDSAGGFSLDPDGALVELTIEHDLLAVHVLPKPGEKESPPLLVNPRNRVRINLPNNSFLIDPEWVSGNLNAEPIDIQVRPKRAQANAEPTLGLGSAGRQFAALGLVAIGAIALILGAVMFVTKEPTSVRQGKPVTQGTAQRSNSANPVEYREERPVDEQGSVQRHRSTAPIENTLPPVISSTANAAETAETDESIHEQNNDNEQIPSEESLANAASLAREDTFQPLVETTSTHVDTSTDSASTNVPAITSGTSDVEVSQELAEANEDAIPPVITGPAEVAETDESINDQNSNIAQIPSEGSSANAASLDREDTFQPLVETTSTHVDTSTDSASTNVPAITSNTFTTEDSQELANTSLLATEAVETDLAAQGNSPDPEPTSLVGPLEEFDVQEPLTNEAESNLELAPAPLGALLPEANAKVESELFPFSDLQVISQTPPKYPRIAPRDASGFVDVEFTVDESGRVTDIEVLGTPARYFERSVRDALPAWRFEAVSIDGRIVPVRTMLRITFRG